MNRAVIDLVTGFPHLTFAIFILIIDEARHRPGAPGRKQARPITYKVAH